MRDAYYALLTQDIISGIWFDEMFNYSTFIQILDEFYLWSCSS